MTVIAANLKEMAGDSKMTVGAITAHVDKVFHIRDSFIGVAGDADNTTKFLAWFRKECPPDEVSMNFDDDKSFIGLELNSRGLFLYSNCCEPDKLHDKYFAIGTGAEVAIAAMDMGKSPTEAVRLACKRVEGCGLPVKTLTMKQKNRRGKREVAKPVVPPTEVKT